MTVNNGKRVDVSLPDFEGKAGFQDALGVVELSYLPNRDGEGKKAGDDIEVDGKAYRVLKRGRSAFGASGMVTLTLEPGA